MQALSSCVKNSRTIHEIDYGGIIGLVCIVMCVVQPKCFIKGKGEKHVGKTL